MKSNGRFCWPSTKKRRSNWRLSLEDTKIGKKIQSRFLAGFGQNGHETDVLEAKLLGKATFAPKNG
ncbi:hypothetical protein EFB08_09775 [Rufibacter latericius]|uniref:Uncharacterized protein n=1 Tax=Rufibacter latericius TaxID=2487040 RepID=A0A3M9MMK0_9BACT|nr:hypothetical protein EFB08_09775 [Rufibacter latericius]